MLNSFAFQDSTPIQISKEVVSHRTMTQTSHFANPQKSYAPLQFSPIADKENNNTQNDMQKINTSQLQWYDLNENFKLDESVVEEGLSLHDRLTHPKWQIRRKTYMELIQEVNCEEFSQSWLRTIVQEKNEIAFLEGMRFIYAYVSRNQLHSNVLSFFIPDIIEKGAFLKQQPMSTTVRCSVDFHFVMQESIRKIDTKHPKIIVFCLGFMSSLLSSNEQWTTQDLLKQIFKYSTSLLKHTNKEIRKQATVLFGEAYSMVQESFESLQKQFFSTELRSVQLKELEAVCEKIGKRDSKLLKQTTGILRAQKVQQCDLHQLLPEKFFEVPYMKAQRDKTNKIEQFTQNLEAFIAKNSEIDPYKDYGPVYSVLLHVLQDSNILLYSEGMRCVRGIVKLFRQKLNPTISRHFFHLVLEKLKGSLSKQHQSNVFSVLEDMLLWESLTCDQFLEMILHEVEQGKNMGVRVGCLRWLRDGWLALGLAVQQWNCGSYPQPQDQPLRAFIEGNCPKIEKSLFLLWRRVSRLLKSEKNLNLNLKKACSELLDSLIVIDEAAGIVEVVADVPMLPIEVTARQTDQMQVQLQNLKDKNGTRRQQNDDGKQRYKTEEESGDRGSVDISQRGSTSHLQMKLRGEVPRDQMEVLLVFGRELQMLKKLVITGQDQLVGQKIDDLMQIITNQEQSIHLLCPQLLELLGRLFLDQGRVSSPNIVLKQFVLQILIPINKAHVQLDQRVLLKELKLVFLKMGPLNFNLLQLLLDSLFMCCSIDSLVRVSVKLLQKAILSESPIKSLQVFYTWLAQKLSSSSPVSINATSLETTLEQLIQLETNTTVDIKGLIASIQQFISNEFIISVKKAQSTSFETPNKRIQFSSEEKGVYDLNRDNLQSRVEESVHSGSLEPIIAFLKNMRMVSSFPSPPSSNSPGKPWRRGIGRDITNAPRGSWRNPQELKIEDFKPFLDHTRTIRNTDQVYECLDLLRLLFPQHLGVVLYYALINNLNIVGLLGDVQIQFVLMVYKQVFTQLLQENNADNLSNYIQNTIPILQGLLKSNFELDHLKFIGSSIVYSLTQTKVKSMGEEILHQILQNNSRQQMLSILENDLINFKRLYDILLVWLDNKYQIEIIETSNRSKQQGNSPPPPKLILQHMVSFGTGDVPQEGKYNQEDFDLLELTTPNSNQTININEATLSDLVMETKRDQNQTYYSHDEYVFDQIQQISRMNESHRISNFRQVDDKNKQLNLLDIQQPKKVQAILTSQDIQRIYQEIKEKNAQTLENQSALHSIVSESSLALPSKRNECIQRLRELLLTSTSLYFDIASPLLQHYEHLESAEEKAAFTEDLKLSVVNQTLLEHLSETNYTVLLAIVLRLCTTVIIIINNNNYNQQPATQIEIYSVGNEQGDLAQSLQLILDVLLTARPLNQSLMHLIRVLTEHLPLDLNAEISRTDKMMLRLSLKCLDRMVGMVQGDEVDVFSLLLEVHKFFKFHPAEGLVEGLPSMKELEFYFRQMKSITDRIVLWSPTRALEFVDYIFVKDRQSIFLEYLRSNVQRMMAI